MKSEKKYILPVAASVSLFSIIVFSYVGLPKTFVFGQNASEKPEMKTFATLPANDNTQPQSTMAQPVTSPDKINANNLRQTGRETGFSPLTLKAAAANAKLQYNLAWIFGGKSQRGWFLYAPLIQQTIGAGGKDAGTPEFANAVADWQQKNTEILPDGMIDDKTLYKIIEYWQSRRLNNSDYPSPDQLLTAPIADFYDPTRDAELLKVERETYAAYKRMLAAAIKDKTLNLKLTKAGDALAPEEKFFKIVSAFRSREYQEKLRKAEPNSGRAGLALKSAHFSGRALDLYVGGEPVTTKDFNRAVQIQTPAYKWLVKNAGRFGFVPYFYEPWHWEYIPERLRSSIAPAR